MKIKEEPLKIFNETLKPLVEQIVGDDESKYYDLLEAMELLEYELEELSTEDVVHEDDGVAKSYEEAFRKYGDMPGWDGCFQ